MVYQVDINKEILDDTQLNVGRPTINIKGFNFVDNGKADCDSCHKFNCANQKVCTNTKDIWLCGDCLMELGGMLNLHSLVELNRK